MDKDARDARIEFLKEEIAIFKSIPDDRDWINDNPQIRMQKEIDLLEQGCIVEQDVHGLLVNERFIVGISNHKWRVKGRSVWYRYSTIQQFVEKYVKQ
jgi:hypothetical protein